MVAVPGRLFSEGKQRSGREEGGRKGGLRGQEGGRKGGLGERRESKLQLGRNVCSKLKI